MSATTAAAATSTVTSEEQAQRVDDDVLALLDLSTAKRKKSRKVSGDTCMYLTTTCANFDAARFTACMVQTRTSMSNRDTAGDRTSSLELYNYSSLLDRMYTTLYSDHPHLSKRQRQAMPAFLVSRLSSKSVVWSNFVQVCAVIKRDPQHVLSFITAGV